ncbi:DUF4231 domain-containing protein [Pareuzebyella sediminis]|uniref:DUF4231 domain-containing protein n=1 Tax=Pareuzebyella sediminis TaxID=2607998 RepID=UPI0011F06643|nr:DUF4231 domain-containing protein [Pareuzebyella sediminis]
MKPEEYIEDRLESQRKWYSEKSSLNKDYYNGFKIATIVFSVLIPLIAGSMQFASAKGSISLIVGILGTLVAILTSVLELMKFKEKWINYRTASERLKHEKILWETKTSPYDQPNSFQVLVKRTEAIINGEHSDWSEYIVEPKKQSES